MTKQETKKQTWYKTPGGIIGIIAMSVFGLPIIIGIAFASFISIADTTPHISTESTDTMQTQATTENERKEIVSKYAPVYCANHQNTTVNESTLSAQGWPMADNLPGITDKECETLIGLLYDQRDGWANQETMIKGVAQGKIAIGMTKIEIVYSLGSPKDINKTTTSGGTWEQWVYGGGYVYFDGGYVTSYQN